MRPPPRSHRLLPVALLLALAPVAARAQHDASVRGRVTMADTTRPVANAVVYLGAQPIPTAADVRPVIVDVTRGRLSPRIQIARSGGTLILQNSDPTLRMVRVEEVGADGSLRTLRRVAMPYAGFEQRLPLADYRETRLLRVVGENHERLQVAYLAVLPHPWATLTNADGTFRLTGLRPDAYPVFVWHEALGTLSGRLEIQRGREASVELRYPARR